ncbi:MAG TPA: hypothetical protein VEY50_09545 [Lysobacter sp.]|nr:hypothetical protein [Lysobacter sp.]
MNAVKDILLPAAMPAPAQLLRHPVRDGLKVVLQGGDGRFETIRECWHALADEVRARRPRTLLIVDRLAGGQLTAEQQQSLITSLVGRGFEGVRMAYVVRPQTEFAFAESAELHARVLGYEIRVFDTEAAAERWLRHGEH